jgi:heme exporter protein C
VLFGFIAFAALIAAQVFSILTSPAEGDMGHLQKIMYVHVPAAWMAFISFFVVLVFSVRYLWRKRENDDLLAASAAEVGAAFTGLTLMLGMIWGRPAWGVWWVWDARLTPHSCFSSSSSAISPFVLLLTNRNSELDGARLLVPSARSTFR